MDEKNALPKSLKSRTIPILIALLAIKIVASNFLGLSNNFITNPPLAFPCFSRRPNSVEDKPKKATSAPETKAEQAIKKNKKPILKLKKGVVKAIKGSAIFRGSGSNIF